MAAQLQRLFKASPLACPTLNQTDIAIFGWFCVFGWWGGFTIAGRAISWRSFLHIHWVRKCPLKSATGTSLPKLWKQLARHPARCISVPRLWQKENLIRCQPVGRKLLTASLLLLADYKKSLTSLRLFDFLLFKHDWQFKNSFRFRKFCGNLEWSIGNDGFHHWSQHRTANWSRNLEPARLVYFLTAMNSTFSNFQYLIRYKNLKGETKQDFVYASDATEAQSLAVEFNDELQQHPHLINAILKVK